MLLQFFEGIDWDKAAKHEIEPRYKPPGSGNTDNFDEEFLEMSIDNTPIDPEVIEDIDQDMFGGFTFVAGSAVEADKVSKPSAAFAIVLLLLVFVCLV